MYDDAAPNPDPGIKAWRASDDGVPRAGAGRGAMSGWYRYTCGNEVRDAMRNADGPKLSASSRRGVWITECRESKDENEQAQREL